MRPVALHFFQELVDTICMDFDVPLKMARKAPHHLLLLPGMDGSGALFEPFLDVMPSLFDATVVSYPPDKLLDYCQLLPSIREVMPWDREVIVVAESFAGPLALRFAHVQRPNVRAIVLCASFVSNPVPNPLRWATSFLTRHWLDCEPTRDVVRKNLLGEAAPEAMVDRAVQALRAVQHEVYQHRAQLIRDADARADLQSCKIPVLYLQAGDDEFVGREAAEEIKRVNPNVKCVTLRGPHLLLHRNPREALEAIAEVLSALPNA